MILAFVGCLYHGLFKILLYLFYTNFNPNFPKLVSRRVVSSDLVDLFVTKSLANKQILSANRCLYNGLLHLETLQTEYNRPSCIILSRNMLIRTGDSIHPRLTCTFVCKFFPIISQVELHYLHFVQRLNYSSMPNRVRYSRYHHWKRRVLMNSFTCNKHGLALLTPREY